MHFLALMQYKNFETYLAEYVASFIYGFAYNTATINKIEYPALVSAFCKVSIGYAFDRLTLKHINPSITLAAAAINLIEIKTALLYILCQVLGFTSASALSRLLYGKGFVAMVKKMQCDSRYRVVFLEMVVNVPPECSCNREPDIRQRIVPLLEKIYNQVLQKRQTLHFPFIGFGNRSWIIYCFCF